MTRALDIVLSGIALSVLSPLFALVAVSLRLTGEGEIFFTQSRVGKGGRFFHLYKFATMLKDSPNLGTGTVTLAEDPRIRPLGRLLRKTKLNELPQLWNIFLGEMSIIGPRPQTPRCFASFPTSSQEAIKRVRPGLSGIGSIVFRAEDKMIKDAKDVDGFYDKVIMPYKGRLEEWYVDNQTVRVYFKSIWVTALIVLNPKTQAVWRHFPNLPAPPIELMHPVNWPSHA